MFRKFLAVTLLSGCAAFAPGYLAEADKRAADSFQIISELLAKADLGEYRAASSYDPAVDDYARAIAGMETAKLLAGGSTVAGPAAETARAAQLVVIDACLTNLKSMAALHKSGGLLPNVGLTQTVRVPCDQAVRVLQALK